MALATFVTEVLASEESCIKYLQNYGIISTFIDCSCGWAAYNGLSNMGYDHQTVNHSENFINPVTGYHTQGIERAWVDAKAWCKKSRYLSHLIQSHLDEIAWRKMRKAGDESLVDLFLKDVSSYYMN